LERALAAFGSRIDELVQAAADNPAGTRMRRYSPEDQVAARIELSGPQRRLAKMHAGIDVHGDGSTEPYVGRVQRQALELQPGEDVVAALRRALLGS